MIPNPIEQLATMGPLSVPAISWRHWCGKLKTTMEIFLSRDGEQSGPFDLQTIGTMVAQGQCQMSDLAWSAGLPDWRPLEAVLALAAPPPHPLSQVASEESQQSGLSPLSPLRTHGKIAGFWCIPQGWSFLKIGIPIQHEVESEFIVLTRLNAFVYPALTILAQSKFLVEHFPWLSEHMRREMEGGGRNAFTEPGPARTHAFRRLVKALHEQGWSFVLQDEDTALLGVGVSFQDYAEALRLELSGHKLNQPTHVRLQGIRSVATISLRGEISEPLPLSEPLGRFAQ